MNVEVMLEEDEEEGIERNDVRSNVDQSTERIPVLR